MIKEYSELNVYMVGARIIDVFKLKGLSHWIEGVSTFVFDDKDNKRGIAILGYNDLGEWITYLQIGDEVITDELKVFREDQQFNNLFEDLLVECRTAKIDNIDSNVKKWRTLDELFEGYDGDYEPIEVDWGSPYGVVDKRPRPFVSKLFGKYEIVYRPLRIEDGREVVEVYVERPLNDMNGVWVELISDTVIQNNGFNNVELADILNILNNLRDLIYIDARDATKQV